MTHHPDGDLPDALRQAHHATNNLIAPQHTIIAGKVHTAPSPYKSLTDAIRGQQGTSHGHRARSLPLVWLDALELLTEIDDRIMLEQPAGRDTPDRIQRIMARSYRPQDSHWLLTFAKALTQWRQQIGELLDPQPHWTVAAPCPNCDTTTIYRKDTGGDMVRQPALRLTRTRCECGHCHTKWAPEQYALLARVLNAAETNHTRVI